jgi:hypothetical protein
MAQTNIYDFILAELIKRSGNTNGATGSTVTTLSLINNLTNNCLIAGNVYNNVVFTSEILNLPTGWTIVANTHVLSVTGFAAVTGSTNSISTINLTISIPLISGTIVSVSTVDITDGVNTVTLSSVNTLTGCGTIYYGIKAYSASPTIVGLSEISSAETAFSFTTSGVNRIVFAIPTTETQPIALVDQHENEFDIATDFEVFNDGINTFYTLNWDTQFTGVAEKTYTIKYS